MFALDEHAQLVNLRPTLLHTELLQQIVGFLVDRQRLPLGRLFCFHDAPRCFPTRQGYRFVQRFTTMHTIENPLLSMPSAWCLNQSLHKASEETVSLISAFQAAQGREALPKTPV